MVHTTFLFHLPRRKTAALTTANKEKARVIERNTPLGPNSLRAGMYDLVKASITGSIIGNILLVFGLAALLGGMKRAKLHFNKTAAAMGATMLVLSAIALVIPAIFHAVAVDAPPGSESRMSLVIAVILIGTYILSLIFTLKTHAHLYLGSAGEHAEDTDREAGWSRGRSFAVLLASAAVMSGRRA